MQQLNLMLVVVMLTINILLSICTALLCNANNRIDDAKPRFGDWLVFEFITGMFGSGIQPQLNLRYVPP
jgi:hypothetical protein